MQPKGFGTVGDVSRLKDWAVSVVRHGADSKDAMICALGQELEVAREVCRERENSLKELRGEIKAHALTSSVVQSDLDSWLGIEHTNALSCIYVLQVEYYLQYFLEGSGY